MRKKFERGRLLWQCVAQWLSLCVSGSENEVREGQAVVPMGSSMAAIVLAVVQKVGLKTGEGFRMAASRQKWLKMVLVSQRL